jgi:hypothetical protein
MKQKYCAAHLMLNLPASFLRLIDFLEWICRQITVLASTITGLNIPVLNVACCSICRCTQSIPGPASLCRRDLITRTMLLVDPINSTSLPNSLTVLSDGACNKARMVACCSSCNVTKPFAADFEQPHLDH